MHFHCGSEPARESVSPGAPQFSRRITARLQNQKIAAFGSSYKDRCRSCRRLRSFDLAFEKRKIVRSRPEPSAVLTEVREAFYCGNCRLSSARFTASSPSIINCAIPGCVLRCDAGMRWARCQCRLSEICTYLLVLTVVERCREVFNALSRSLASRHRFFQEQGNDWFDGDADFG